MSNKLLSLLAIFLFVGLGWIILGSVVLRRTGQTDKSLEREVRALWGSPQHQIAPELVFVPDSATADPSSEQRQETVHASAEPCDAERATLIPDSSLIDVAIGLEQRRKGLLWFATYTVDFDGSFSYRHGLDCPGTLWLTYTFPSVDADYSDFHFDVDGLEDPQGPPVNAAEMRVRRPVTVKPGQQVDFRLAYRSRGIDSWAYSFGTGVNRVKNFRLTVDTDFRDIDFLPRGISPMSKEPTDDGWSLVWASDNLISGYMIGLDMPRRLNPGPLAARISFFAPVCLAFFFVWIFVITLFRGIDLHPMNYLFLAAAFFAFHLLLAHTVDHMPLVPAFVLSSAVSVFLVVSYLRLVVGWRFAAVEAGISQLIYLVFFSWAHFYEGYTGLIVTVGSILTLFSLMQLTGRFDWRTRLGRAPDRASPATP